MGRAHRWWWSAPSPWGGERGGPADWSLALQVKKGGEAAHRARRGVRQAVARAAEVVACALSCARVDPLSDH